jgi:hypothetical protein
VTIEVEGRLKRCRGSIPERRQERSRNEVKKEGWRRDIRKREKLESLCQQEMKRWRDEPKSSSEQAWQTWLEAYNKISEEAVGRVQRKKERKWMREKWDHSVHEAMKEKNRLRKEMGRVEGEERVRVVDNYRYWRGRVRKMLNAKRKRMQQQMNEKLESFKGKNEKAYWRILKNLAGIKKKEEKLPEEVRMGNRVGRGEKSKEIWNEAFSLLGKVSEEDKHFDKKEYLKIRQKVEQWESEKSESESGKIEDLDKEIEMSE